MSKYYIVDELENYDMCFKSIKNIELIAIEEGMKLEDLTIYEAQMINFTLDAESIVESEIDGGDYHEIFTFNEVDKEKIEQLQDFLDNWCSEINTNSYEPGRKLSIEEVLKLKDLENQKEIYDPYITNIMNQLKDLKVTYIEADISSHKIIRMDIEVLDNE